MSSVSMHFKYWDGEEDLVDITPEGAATMMNLMLGDGSEIRYDAQGQPWLQAEDVLVRLMDDMFSKTTLERDSVLAHFYEDILSIAPTQDEDRGQLKRISERPEAKECCKEAGPQILEICEDNRISLQTLYQVQGLRQLGKFLLCRTISLAFNGVWLEVVVEDPSGQSGILLLTNFTPTKYSRDVGRQEDNEGRVSIILGALPLGSLILVKNVYALPRAPHTAPRPSSIYFLQAACHNPADVVLLTPKKMRELLPDLVWQGPIPQESFWDDVLAGKSDAEIIEALKRKGNEAFVFKRYTDAIRCYDLALDYVGGGGNDGQFTAIWSNKAASFLGLGCFLKALESTDKVLLRDPVHVKAIYRKVKAMVGLRLCAQALAFIKQKFAAAPSLKENDDLSRLMEMIPVAGQKPYVDSLAAMLKHCEDVGVERTGPVEFRPNPITGRGVFATRDIEPEDSFIFIQRSLAKVVEVEADREGNDLSDAELVGLIANKIAFAPELGPQIYSLLAGKKLGTLDPEDPAANQVNIYRIQKIVEYHSRYSPGGMHIHGPFRRTTGLWGISPFLSQLNHSCSEANVVSQQYENWNFFLASKPIKKGEEMFTNWINGSDSLKCRREALEKLDMECHCRLCQRDSEDSVQVKRKFKKLWKQFSQFSTHDYETSSKKVDSALEIINQIADLRPDAPHLHAIMIDPAVVSLCAALFHVERYGNKYVVQHLDLGKKIVLAAETMNNLNLVLVVAIDVMRGYLKLRNIPEAKEWARKVKKYSIIAYGLLPRQFSWAPDLFADMRKAGLNPAKL